MYRALRELARKTGVRFNTFFRVFVTLAIMEKIALLERYVAAPKGGAQ